MEDNSSPSVAPGASNKQKTIIGLLCALLVVSGIALIIISMNLSGSASDNLDGAKKATAAGQSYANAQSSLAGQDSAAQGEGANGSANGAANDAGSVGSGTQGAIGGTSVAGNTESGGGSQGNGASAQGSVGGSGAGTGSAAQSPQGEGSNAGAQGQTPGSSENTSQASFEINCTSVLDRMGELSPGIAASIPPNGQILSRSTINFSEGASVFDLLKQACSSAGITLRSTGGNFGSGVYVTTIGPLAEFDCGSQSGWKYYVNGQQPSMPCSAYKVQPGDAVVWSYTCEI